MASGGSGFSLSLGGAGGPGGKKPAARKPPTGEREGPVREEVLGFGADGGLKTAAGPAAKRGPLVISKQENSYK